MAHKGLPWELEFRRDFNLNVQTYRGGIAKRYDILLSNFMGDLTPTLGGTSWRCGPSSMPLLDTLQFDSAAVSLGGFLYSLRLTIQVTGVPAGYVTRVHLLRAGPGIIWTTRIGHDGRTFGPVGDPTVNQIIYFDPAIFPTGAGSPANDPVPVPYPP